MIRSATGSGAKGAGVSGERPHDEGALRIGKDRAHQTATLDAGRADHRDDLLSCHETSSLWMNGRRPPAGCLGARRMLLVGQSFTSLAIEYLVSNELFRGPRRTTAAEVLLEPLEMSGIVERHLVPTGPVTGVGVDDQA